MDWVLAVGAIASVASSAVLFWFVVWPARLSKRVPRKVRILKEELAEAREEIESLNTCIEDQG